MLRGFEEFGDLAPLEAMPRAKAAAQRALELDPGVAEGHGWSGVASLLFDWDWAAAESSFCRSIELRPDYSLAHAWYAVLLMARGRHDEALAQSEHAAELDPLALTIHTVIGQCHHFARRFDEALARHRATLELDPGNIRALLWSSRTYRAIGRPDAALRTIEQGLARWGRTPGLLGELGTVLARLARRSEALAILDELRHLEGPHSLSPFYQTAIWGGLQEEQEFRRGMEEMEAARSGIVPFLRDPVYDPYRSASWFQDLLRRTGVE